MVARKFFLIALAVVLLVRTTHCLYVDAELCAAISAHETSDPPLSDPAESDPNETGCPCKGAVYAVACLPADLPLLGKFVLPAELNLSPQVAELVDLAPAVAVYSDPSPISGRILRAQLACWQV